MSPVPRVLPQIDTVVVLMLENRSLDNVLGWLHADGAPVHLWPEGSTPSHFDGIPKGTVNSKRGFPWTPLQGMSNLGAQQWRSPRWDPYEGMGNVQIQMYGNGDGFMRDTKWGSNIPMQGFAADFPAGDDQSVGEVMGAYTRDELPVLYGLAENFAVSDRWFSSVPTETDPNRAFALCGTSQGAEGDIPFERIFTAPTLFNGLNPMNGGRNPGKDWAIYWQYNGAGAFDPPGNICFTQGRFSQVQAALAAPNSRGRVAPYQDLLTALRQGDDIPSFCYVEPYWGWGVGLPDGSDYVGFQGNDYHPPTWVGPAEWDLNELYVALTNSRQWERMLFIITFDEHGGTFDHVAPARAVNPDGKIGPSGFRFERMGVRVPTILVSPFVTPRTVFRAPNGSSAVFDHTSIISTVLGWAGTDPSFITAMGKRAAAAPRFDGVLAPTRVQGTAPRFVVPAHYQHQGGPKGAHNLGFDADGLTVHHHRAALVCAADPDGYVAALRNISRT